MGEVRAGGQRLCLGMGKKILLANPMAHIADTVFGAAGLRWFDAWFGVVAYAFQIYFDFSAYSDMAVGLALMLGFLFTKNFNDPYRAESITDFWRRWHLSLSTWLRDYLYIPLGGNKLGEAHTCCNLFTVMLLGGLWHGASWTFVIWGAIHGAMLRATGRRKEEFLFAAAGCAEGRGDVSDCLCGVGVLRAESLSIAWRFVGTLFGGAAGADGAGILGAVVYTKYHLFCFAVCAVVVWGMPQAWNFTQRITPWKS